MFLDVRDQWPPVPPQRPQPQTGHPAPLRRRDAIIGLIVAFNLAVVLLAPIAGSTMLRAVATLLRALAR